MGAARIVAVWLRWPAGFRVSAGHNHCPGVCHVSQQRAGPGRTSRIPCSLGLLSVAKYSSGGILPATVQSLMVVVDTGLDWQGDAISVRVGLDARVLPVPQ